MKTSRILAFVTLLIGSATITFAGPGPQYWARLHSAAPAEKSAQPAATAEKAAPTATIAKATPDFAKCAQCACCCKAS